jgi:lantibiotic biosynthesis protein
VRLGDELIDSAEKTTSGWSWRADDGTSHRNLTGLSHGAAGAAHALLELFEVTGVGPYRAAAEQAVRYERTWFSEEVRNWPDFREEPRRRKPSRPGTFRTQWCHGAAGIALTRLHAQDVLDRRACRGESLVALATTESDTAAALERGTLSYCLCHGLGGNADVLLEGRDVLPSGAVLAEAIGRAGLAAHARTGVPWPCGIPVPGGETPGLMLGLAGIGHFYARLALPTVVPTLLLPSRRDFVRKLQALAAVRHGHRTAEERS